MKLGTIAAGVGTVTVITTNYLPQYIYWNNATTPTGLQVKIQTEGILVDLDAKGINAFAALRLPGRKTSGFYIPLANGFVGNKVVEFTFTNGVAAAIDVYGFSFQNGNLYVQSIRTKALASSGIDVSKFAAMALPDVAAGDIINITYKDGFIQQSSDVELAAIPAFTEEDVNGTNVVLVDNFRQNVKSVRFTPAADQIVHVMRFLSIGGLSQSINT